MEQWTNNCIICLLGKSCQLFLWKTLDHSLYSKLLLWSDRLVVPWDSIFNDDIINMKSNRNTMALFQYLLSVRWRHIRKSMNSSRRFLQRLLSYQLSFQVKNQDVWSNSKRGSISNHCFSIYREIRTQSHHVTQECELYHLSYLFLKKRSFLAFDLWIESL